MFSVKFAAGFVAAVGILASAATAEAATVFDFSYSGAGYSGSGEFTSNDAASAYYITGVSGEANGSAITGVSTYAGASNLLSYPSQPFVDQGGISFSTADGIAYNLFTIPGSPGAFVLSEAVDAVGYASNGVAIQLQVNSAVPEPATWAMMIVGLGGLGLALRRGRRTAGSAALA